LLHAWYCHAPRPIASALFCHGNTGNLTTSADIIPHLQRAGLNVLFFDYRGFGKSSGIASIGGVISDAMAAAAFHDTLRPRDLPSILYGFSLGGAIGSQVAKHHPFDGVILQSTFTSLREISRVAFPRAPLHLMAGGLFDTLAVVRRLRVPLLVLHGDADEVVPHSMASRLFDACRGSRRIQKVTGGLHKDLFQRDPEALVRAIHTFAGTLHHRAATLPHPHESVAASWLHAGMRALRRALRPKPAPGMRIQKAGR
jgi:pimeloyl-ACP methyl ester carboxylesterase